MRNRWMLALAAGFVGAAVQGAEFKVDSAATVRKALREVGPGDTILVKPGVYDMGDSFSTGNSGTADKPITFRCEGDKGYATFKVRGQIGFRVKSRFWVIQGIDVEGSEKSTEATLFLSGPGGCGDIKIIDCKVSGSAQHGIKSSRTREHGIDNVLIDHVEVCNTAATGIDLVSGDNWIISHCYVHDYSKGGGVCYGIFLKGGGKNGIIESCVVDGKKRPVTVGISFGGGTTGARWLPLVNGKVGPEHENGIARNNIVLRTSDTAYHSKKATACNYYNNLAWDCGTFQCQASWAVAPTLINNLIAGRYQGVSPKSRDNLTRLQKAWFVDPDKDDFRLTAAGKAALVGKGEDLPDNPIDFFGTPRKSGSKVLGPVLPDATVSTKWVSRRSQ